MKRFLLLLSLLLSRIVYADTTNLTFIVDNETYSTSTCTVGESVTLPTPPSKTGYEFDGWQPVFYRGTFANWASIPTAASGYVADSNASTIPNENDYIIVNDSSDIPEYGETIEIQVSTNMYIAYWTNYCRTYIEDINYGCDIKNTEGIITIINGVIRSLYSTSWQSNIKDVCFKGTKYSAGTTFAVISIEQKNNGTYYAKFINGYPYSGKWLLRYHGDWGDYNRGGWVAEKQLD